MTEQLRLSEFALHLREIRSRAGLVMAFALAALVFVGAWRLGQPTRYEASAVIQVSIGTEIEDNGDITEFRTRQLGELARTSAVLDAVLESSQLDIDRGQLEDRISLELLDTPGFLRVTARTPTAAESATLANAVANQLVDLPSTGPVTPVESARVVNPADAADAARSSGPSTAARDAVVAALAVAILVGEGSVVIRIMSGRFSPTDPAVDAANVLDAPVVDLRHERRHDVVDFVIEELRPHRWLLVLQLGSIGSNRDILTLTRMASHIGDRVLLIDGDEGRSNLHGRLGLEPGPGLSDLAAGAVGLRDAIRPGGRQVGAAVMTAGDPSRSTHRAPTVLDRIEPHLEASGADLVFVSVTSASSPEEQAGIIERLGYPVVLVFDPEEQRIPDVRLEADRLRQLGSAVVGGVLVGRDPSD